MSKILVIEDEMTILENIAEALELSGYDVLQASNGLMGIDLALSQSPRLILCDIMMDKADGFEVLSAVRAAEGMSATPFVFVSARSDNALLEQCRQMGVNDFLSKPFTTDTLLAIVSKYLD